MADLLGDDVFGDPNKVAAAPTSSTETSDVFASAVSMQEAPTPVPVPVPGA